MDEADPRVAAARGGVRARLAGAVRHRRGDVRRPHRRDAGPARRRAAGHRHRRGDGAARPRTRRAVELRRRRECAEPPGRADRRARAQPVRLHLARGRGARPDPAAGRRDPRHLRLSGPRAAAGRADRARAAVRQRDRDPVPAGHDRLRRADVRAAADGVQAAGGAGRVHRQRPAVPDVDGLPRRRDGAVPDRRAVAVVRHRRRGATGATRVGAGGRSGPGGGGPAAGLVHGAVRGRRAVAAALR